MKGAGGIGFFGALTILFVALKLLGHIDWHWALVLMPLWLPFSIAVVVLGCMVLWVFVQGFMTGARKAKRERDKGRR